MKKYVILLIALLIIGFASSESTAQQRKKIVKKKQTAAGNASRKKQLTIPPPDDSLQTPSSKKTEDQPYDAANNGTGRGQGIGSGNGSGVGTGSGNGTGDGNSKQTAVIPDKTCTNGGATALLKIISKPRPEMTEAARQNSVQGVVRLRVLFAADGTIQSVSPVSGLPHGLTESAIKAAKLMRFIPAQKCGAPMSVSRLVEYSFTIY